jgi:hypothetical protein
LAYSRRETENLVVFAPIDNINGVLSQDPRNEGDKESKDDVGGVHGVRLQGYGLK